MVCPALLMLEKYPWLLFACQVLHRLGKWVNLFHFKTPLQKLPVSFAGSSWKLCQTNQSRGWFWCAKARSQCPQWDCGRCVMKGSSLVVNGLYSFFSLTNAKKRSLPHTQTWCSRARPLENWVTEKHPSSPQAPKRRVTQTRAFWSRHPRGSRLHSGNT